MPTQEAIQYLTKTEAAHWFQRSERSLSRDITNAIKARDQDVLEHVRLRLEDGTVRPSTDINIGEIIRLRDDGQNPTWELAVVWLEARYGKRGVTPQEEAEAEEHPLPRSADRPVAEEAAGQARELPAEPALRLAVLEAITSELETRNREKDSQIRRLEIELDRRAEERREENELQKQNNVLMQQIYNLLSTMQESSGEVSLLPTSRSAASLPTTMTVDREPTKPAQAEFVPTPEATAMHQEGSHVNERPPRQKKRPVAKRKAHAPKQPPTTQSAQAKPVKKPTSTLFPTFDRVARSLFRR
jgi:ribosomal 50S subunit-recycling heat shock protein